MMSDEIDPAVKNEVFELCEKALNDELKTGDLQRLEVLVIGDVGARNIYVEYMHQHAGLYWQHTAEGEAFPLTALVAEITANESGMDSGVGSVGESIKAAEFGKGELNSLEGNIISASWTWPKLAAAAAMLVGGVILGWGVAEKKSPQNVVATLVQAANCSWQGGALPTEEGAELKSGRLRLQEGLARLKFASGVELTLEAPVDIELISPMLCRLHRGTVVAKVPEPAQGFTIETASATLVDYGTEFGVHVGEEGGDTDVLVFDGIVDVEQKMSGEVRRLTTGNGSKVSGEVFETTESASLELVVGNAEALILDRTGGDNRIVITTADGRGEDAYVQATDSDTHTSEVLLLTKNSEVFDKGLGYSRKVYLRFDLDRISSGEKMVDAELRLTVKRSNFGYASFVPDSTFVVYGLHDDQWQRNEINWDNAPANTESGGGADTAVAVELGSFDIPQGVYSGEVGIEGDALIKFLQDENDDDGMVTLMVTRRTGEIHRGGGLVHAFASKRHPSASPPTLQIKLSEAE